MKTINQLAIAQKQYGTEPIVGLKIYGRNGGTTRTFADRDTGTWDGRILSFSGITYEQTEDAAAGLASASVTLTDFDDSLKALTNNDDLEGLLVDVMHVFLGEVGSPTVIFRGKINGPLQWSEGDRTLGFGIISTLEEKQFGFALTEDNAPLLTNPDAIGRPWPAVFGWPSAVPALLVQLTPHGELERPVSLASFVNERRLYEQASGENVDPDDFVLAKGELEVLEDTEVLPDDVNVLDTNTLQLSLGHTLPVTPPEQPIEVEVDGVIFKGYCEEENTLSFKVTEANAPKWKNVALAVRPVADKDRDNPKVLWLTADNIDLANHYVHSTVTRPSKIDGRNKVVVSSVENICVRQEGRKCWFKYPFKKEEWVNAKPAPQLPGWTISGYGLLDDECVLPEVRAISKSGLVIDIEEFVTNVKLSLLQRQKSEKDKNKDKFGPLKAQLDLIEFVKAAFWSAPEGAVVRQWNPTNGDKYVCNMFESEEVNGVYAVRTVDGKDYFTPIPQSYFEIELADDLTADIPGAPAVCCTIEFPRALESFATQGWKKDTIYVTQRSTVASTGNSVEAIQYLIDNYTNLTPNSASFTAAETDVDPFPAHFAIHQVTDSLRLAKDIAWQSRCGLLLDGDEAKIVYLSKPPTPVLTVDEEITEFKTVTLSQTGLDYIRTKLTGEYALDGGPEELNGKSREILESRIYTVNTDKYGVIESEHDFFIYNHAAMVQYSLYFWAHRYANSFRIIEASLFTDAMGLEPFDAVVIDYDSGTVNPTGETGVIESVTHDVHSARVNVRINTGVLAGETDQYSEFWLNDAGFETPANDSETETLATTLVNYDTHKIGAEELMREIRKLEQRAKKLAKVKEKDPQDRTKFLLEPQAAGPFEPATGTQFTAYAPNPWEDIRVGDFVLVEMGQDGVHYMERMPADVVFGVVDEISGSRDENGKAQNGNAYRVKLVEMNRTGVPVASPPHFTQAPLLPLLTDAPISESPSTTVDEAEDQTGTVYVDAFNMSEEHYSSGMKGYLPDGYVVMLTHWTGNDGRDYWFFYAPPDLTSLRVEDCYLNLEVEEGEPGQLLSHTEKVIADPTYTGDPGLAPLIENPEQCDELTVILDLRADIAAGQLRIFPPCLKMDAAGHMSIRVDDDELHNTLDPTQCADPILLDLGLLDVKVAPTAGDTPGALDDVLTVDATWITAALDGVAPNRTYKLTHGDPDVVNGLIGIVALEEVTFTTNKITLNQIVNWTDAKGHVNDNEEAMVDSEIIGDAEWIQISDEVVVGDTHTVTIEHIGPSTGSPFAAVASVAVVTPVGSEETTKGTHVTIDTVTVSADAKGHVTDAANSEDPATDIYVPQMLKHLKDVDGTLAPATGDLFQYDGAKWVKVATTDVTVVTDVQVDGTTRKLQKKTRSVKVIVNAAESGWTDIHTGVACP